MAEGVQGYPRWDGQLSTVPTFPVIAAQELRRAWFNQWTRAILTVVVFYSVLSMGLTQARSFGSHTTAEFVDFLNLLRWGALGVAATMAGPALLEDKRRMALELYLSRAVTRADYLLGKGLAVLGVTTVTLWVPALLYWAISFLVFEEHPDAWLLVPAKALLYALMWGALVSGLGLGLSCVARSSRAATLLLVGSFAVADVFIGELLGGITRNETLQVVSPFASLSQQTTWLFGVAEAPHAFPEWWGLLAWLGLTLVGWALVLLKHPRIAGEERADR